jgi:hypothetical protein
MDHISCPKCGRSQDDFTPWGRNLRYEVEWLKKAGADERFIEAVQARLRTGAKEYGVHQYLDADCPQEAQEECLDVPGWLVLASLSLYRSETEGLDPALARVVRNRFLTAAMLAVKAYAEIERARTLLRNFHAVETL